MLKYLIQSHQMQLLPATVLVLFFLIMSLIFVWIFRPLASQTYAHVALQAIDFEKDPKGEQPDDVR